jgi:hypothetical protein
VSWLLAGHEVRDILDIFACCVSGFLPDFSMVSTIAGGSATHVNETVADTTIQNFLTKNNTVNKNPRTQHAG